MKKYIFISHSSKDKTLVNRFVDDVIIKGAGVARTSLYFTSGPGTGISSGNNLMEDIQRGLESCKIVVALVTQNYLESEICKAELSAAWVQNKLFPLLEPGLGREELVKQNQLFTGMFIGYYDDRDRLNELSDRLQSQKICAPNVGAWNSAVDSWLQYVNTESAVESKSIGTASNIPGRPGKRNELSHSRTIAGKRENVESGNISRERVCESGRQGSFSAQSTEKKPDSVAVSNIDLFKDTLNELYRNTSTFKNVTMTGLWCEEIGYDLYVIQDEHNDARAEIEKARLKYDESSESWEVDSTNEEIVRSLELVAELHDQLIEGEQDEMFSTWFRDHFGSSMDLAQRSCWNSLIADRRRTNPAWV